MILKEVYVMFAVFAAYIVTTGCTEAAARPDGSLQSCAKSCKPWMEADARCHQLAKAAGASTPAEQRRESCTSDPAYSIKAITCATCVLQTSKIAESINAAKTQILTSSAGCTCPGYTVLGGIEMMILQGMLNGQAIRSMLDYSLMGTSTKATTDDTNPTTKSGPVPVATPSRTQKPPGIKKQLFTAFLAILLAHLIMF